MVELILELKLKVVYDINKVYGKMGIEFSISKVHNMFHTIVNSHQLFGNIYKK